MKKTKLPITALTLLLVCFVTPKYAAAQWSIGGSYQIRNDAPKKGFGVQIKRQILRKIPIVDIGLRAHFSYFNEDNRVTAKGVTFGKMKYYDYGLDAVGGVPLGFVKPYIGIGIGSNKYKFKSSEDLRSGSDSKVYWNSFIGVDLTILPILHPFVEYRFVPTKSPSFAKNFDSKGRLVIGLLLSF
jgi:opacity protein-like surface antigen